MHTRPHNTPQVLRPGRHAVWRDLLLLRRTGNMRGPRRWRQGVRAQEGRGAPVRPQQAALQAQPVRARGQVLLEDRA